MDKQQLITISCLVASTLFFLASVFEGSAAFIPLGILFLAVGGFHSRKDGKTV